MDNISLSEVPYLLLEEAAALTTLGKILGTIDGLDPRYEDNFQIQDLSSLGYLVRQSATRIHDLQEQVELAFNRIPERTLEDVSESTTTRQHRGPLEPIVELKTDDDHLIMEIKVDRSADPEELAGMMEAAAFYIREGINSAENTNSPKDTTNPVTEECLFTGQQAAMTKADSADFLKNAQSPPNGFFLEDPQPNDEAPGTGGDLRLLPDCLEPVAEIIFSEYL
jgi:hypothetical protein